MTRRRDICGGSSPDITYAEAWGMLPERKPAYVRSEPSRRRAMATLLREAADAIETDDLGLFTERMERFEGVCRRWVEQRRMVDEWRRPTGPEGDAA